jgi:protein-S-isoprenylcysteine O-methyltransferase Ste14
MATRIATRLPFSPNNIDSAAGVRYSWLSMIGIALGAASFLVVFWVDAASLKGMRHVKPLLWLVSVGLFAAGLVFCARDPACMALPAGLRIAAATAGAVFLLLLVWSLFIEIPFRSAYVRAGSPSGLVTRGTYALCRHPGVLWLAGLLVSAFLATGSMALLIATPVWIALDTVYVVLQEKLFFGRMFGADYAAYQEAVPMLIPRPGSIRACAQTLFQPRRM